MPLALQGIGPLGRVGSTGSRDGVADGWVPGWPHIGCQGPGPFIGGLPPVGQAGPSDLRLCQICCPGPAVPLISLAKLHTNCVLARGDAVLFPSQIAASPEARASLCAVPVTDGSLFGQYVHLFLKNQAELWRETALITGSQDAQMPGPVNGYVRLFWRRSIWRLQA